MTEEKSSSFGFNELMQIKRRPFSSFSNKSSRLNSKFDFNVECVDINNNNEFYIREMVFKQLNTDKKLLQMRQKSVSALGYAWKHQDHQSNYNKVLITTNNLDKFITKDDCKKYLAEIKLNKEKEKTHLNELCKGMREDNKAKFDFCIKNIENNRSFRRVTITNNNNNNNTNKTTHNSQFLKNHYLASQHQQHLVNKNAFETGSVSNKSVSNKTSTTSENGRELPKLLNSIRLTNYSNTKEEKIEQMTNLNTSARKRLYLEATKKKFNEIETKVEQTFESFIEEINTLDHSLHTAEDVAPSELCETFRETGNDTINETINETANENIHKTEEECNQSQSSRPNSHMRPNQIEIEPSQSQNILKNESKYTESGFLNFNREDDEDVLTVSSLNSEQKKQYKTYWPTIEEIEKLLGITLKKPEPPKPIEEPPPPPPVETSKGKPKKGVLKKSATKSSERSVESPKKPKSPIKSPKSPKSPKPEAKKQKSVQIEEKQSAPEVKETKPAENINPIAAPTIPPTTEEVKVDGPDPSSQPILQQPIQSLRSNQKLVNILPSALCPSSLKFSKKLAVKDWLNNCNFQQSLKTTPLI